MSAGAVSDLAAAVAEARRRAARGEAVELAGLAGLLAAVPPGADAAGSAAILDELGLLVETLERGRDEAAARLAALAAGGRAGRAYGGAGGGG